MTSSTGKLEVEVELKSSAEKVWESIVDSVSFFPKACPDLYKSIEVLEGDGKSAGTVRVTHFADETLAASSVEKIESVDGPNKSVAYSVIEGDLKKYYKTFKAGVGVHPKGGGGSGVKWWCEYEKASEEVPDPNVIRDFAVKNFLQIDAYLLQA